MSHKYFMHELAHNVMWKIKRGRRKKKLFLQCWTAVLYAFDTADYWNKKKNCLWTFFSALSNFFFLHIMTVNMKKKKKVPQAVVDFNGNFSISSGISILTREEKKRKKLYHKSRLKIIFVEIHWIWWNPFQTNRLRSPSIFNLNVGCLENIFPPLENNFFFFTLRALLWGICINPLQIFP